MSFFNRRQSEMPPPKPQETTPSGAPPRQLMGFETVLGANSAMEGVLRSDANIRLDGTFSGTLEISANILIGETAKIHADINARNISIAGTVRGNVAGKKVQLLRTGRIWGDIQATALTTEEGGFIDGKITMVDPEAKTPDYAPPEVEEAAHAEEMPDFVDATIVGESDDESDLVEDGEVIEAESESGPDDAYKSEY